MSTIVVGAGLAGMALGAALRERGADVTVLEAADRAGGVIRSERVDGLLIEHGPTSLRGASIEAWAAILRLGLGDRVLQPTGDHRLRYVLKNGELVALPAGIAGLLTTPHLSLRGRLRVLCEPLVRGRPVDGESVFDLLARRVGPEAADRLGTPFVGGIFGGDPRDVDAEATFARLVGWERTAGSLMRGSMAAPKPPADAPRAPIAFHEGMEELTRALAARVNPTLGCRVTGVRRQGTGWRVATSDGEMDAEHVAIATPAVGFLPEIAEAQGLPSAPIAAVHLAWRAGDVAAPAGFGWLCHPSETRDALGAIHVSTIFPSHAPDRVMVRVMLGGTRSPGLPHASDDALVAHARGVVGHFQGLEAEPIFAHVARSLPGIPQYPPGFPRRLEALRATGLHWLGWGWTGIGLPDQLVAAEAVAERIHPAG